MHAWHICVDVHTYFRDLNTLRKPRLMRGGRGVSLTRDNDLKHALELAHSDTPRVVRLSRKPARRRVPSPSPPGPCVRRPRLLSLPRSTRSRRTAHHFTSSGARVYVVDVQCTKTAHLQHTMYQSARMCRPRVPDPINHRRPLLNIMTRTTGLAPLCCSGMTI